MTIDTYDQDVKSDAKGGFVAQVLAFTGAAVHDGHGQANAAGSQ